MIDVVFHQAQIFFKYGTYGDECNRHFLTEQAENPDKHFLFKINYHSTRFMIYSNFNFQSFMYANLLFGACKLLFFLCFCFCNNGSVCIFGIGTDGDCPKKYFSLKATSYDPNL